MALSACASVQLGGGSEADVDGWTNERPRHHVELVRAYDRLEQHPWNASEVEAGIVNMLFGGAAAAPKRIAEVYINDIDARGLPLALQVRRDLAQTLAAIDTVARAGDAATRSLEPVPSDLRTIEAAIVETRQYRQVYTEALTMISKRSGDVDRHEIRDVKAAFTSAILDLGAAADALSNRLDEAPKHSFASTEAQ